ncbi:MAG: sigma-70 family RNA polymerase sigma factor [Planctomycetes bacterium]|nr:sigma-70 family RNA polymerase sigma factor [Planctomycetota bacterium]
MTLQRPNCQRATASVEEVLPGGPEKLIEGCQGLVRSLAWKVHRKLPPSTDIEDLIAFGQLGLVAAARAFDPSLGGKFITYAYYRIRGAIFDGLSKMSWFSRYDYHSSRYERMANEVLRLECEDTDAVPGRNLEEDVAWFKGITTTLSVVYLATCFGSEADEEMAGSLEDRSVPSPAAVTIERDLGAKLHDLIDALPADAGKLIRSVYFEGQTLQEAGRTIGVSKAWASRLHRKTLHRLAFSLRQIGIGAA